MKISMIVACGVNGEIGMDNKMLWHIPEDFKTFKRITIGNHIVMGRKTFESIGSPLPNRTSMVLSHNEFEYEGVEVYKSVEDIIKEAKLKNIEELFIIGGGKIYELFMPLSDKLYVSHVEYNGEADVFFPKINKDIWNIAEEIEYPETAGKNGIIPAWKFTVYEK